MADCFDLNAEIKKVEAELRATQKLVRSMESGTAKRNKKPPETPSTFKTFSMADGTKMKLDPMEFWGEVERLNKGLGEDRIRELVQQRFDEQTKPNGSAGLNINYSQMDLTKENVTELLELMGENRKASEFGQDLMMPFTKEAAGQQLMAEIGLRGGNVEEIARSQARKYRQIDKLPLSMAMSKLMRSDSTRHLADQLEDVASLMDTIGVSDVKKQQLARAAQYANFFEQFDALMSRKVGQALAARKFALDEMESVLQSNPLKYEDVYTLTADTIEDGSLAAQIFDAIKKNDAPALRRLARVKRLSDLTDTPINEPNFWTSLKLLNHSRKANLFSSPATWIQRNVVSGALVNATYMMEDVQAGAFRVGVRDGFKATRMAAASTYSGMNAAFSNALDMLTDGKTTFTREGSIEGLKAGDLINRKAEAYRRLNDTWEDVMSRENWAGKPVDVMRLLNDSARVATGFIVEKLTEGRSLPDWGVLGEMAGQDISSTAGYSPIFSLMNGGDEVTRKMAFDWKVTHESYIRAVEDWDSAVELSDVKKSDWVTNRAEQLANGAVFSGVMTDDQLAKVRRQTFGTAQFGDMDNETLRLKMFNDLKGTPNPTSEMGSIGVQRGMDATFTSPLRDKFNTGMQLLRQVPLIGWEVPVWQTTANGFKWMFGLDIYYAIPKQLMLERKYGFLTAKEAAERMREADNFSAKDLAQARAKTLVAIQLALATNALWEQGVFTDGGSFNSDNNRMDAGTIPPYSFSLGLTGSMQMSKLAIPGRTIDLVDLMGLQADLSRARSEYVINDQDFTTFMHSTVMGYARVLEEKNTLESVVNLWKFLISPATGENVEWQSTVASQMSGIMPYSGLLLSAFRGFDDPNKAAAGRREFTPEEEQLFGENPDFGLFQDFRDLLSRNLPTRRPTEERDWMGRKRQRPFGLPLDLTQPFAPVIVSDTPLDRWLSKHRLGAMPNADRRLGSRELGTGYRGTMTEPQYNSYRIGMYSYRGEVPAAEVLGEANAVDIDTGVAVYQIDDYVMGNTLLEALTKLSRDPDYNADLNTANSPSLQKAMGRPLNERSLADRKFSADNPGQDPRQVLRVYNAIVNYYSWAGAQAMMREHPDFVQRALGTSGPDVQLEAIIEDLEATPMGLSPQ